MAERRMFAKSIVLSDAFLDMPMTTRCLYFTLGMLADDDGFVGNPKAIMRQCGANEDDLKILLAKRFVLGFDTGVIVIKHWRMNNYLQNDRHKTTTYIEELNSLTIDDKGSYTEQKNSCIQNVYEMYTQDSIDKNSIVKNSKEKIYINNKDAEALINQLEYHFKRELTDNEKNQVLDWVEFYKDKFKVLDICVYTCIKKNAPDLDFVEEYLKQNAFRR